MKNKNYTPYDWVSFAVGGGIGIFLISFSKNLIGVLGGILIIIILLIICFRKALLTNDFIIYFSVFGKKKKILMTQIKVVEFRGGFKTKRNYILHLYNGDKIKFYGNEATDKLLVEICEQNRVFIEFNNYLKK